MRKIFLFCYLLTLTAIGIGQTTLINPAQEGGFDAGGTFTANGWTVVNHTTNIWHVGTAAAGNWLTGNGAYISNNGGTTNAYTHAVQASHFYRDVTVPAGESVIQLSFNWRNAGEASYDAIVVSYCATNTTPNTSSPTGTNTSSSWTGGTSVAISGNLTGQSATTQTFTAQLPASLAGTTFRLVFTWKNDNSAGTTSPAASIDNISLTSRVATPLNGSYTINAANATTSPMLHNGSGNFQTFAAAIAFMNVEGVSGPTTFNVAAGTTYTETALLFTTSGTSSNTISFVKSGSGANPKIVAAGTTGTTDFAVQLQGVDYYTFNGIDIEASGSALEFGYYLTNASATNGAQFNTIQNCTITMTTALSGGAGIRSNTVTSATSAAGANSNNTFKNLRIANAYRSVHLSGTASPNWDANNAITADAGYTNGTNTSGYNDFGNISVAATSDMRAIEITGQNNISISKTEIRNMTSTTTTGTSAVAGIFVTTTANGNVTIENNLIHDLTGSSTSTQVVYGIWSGSNANTTGTLTINANRIYKLTGASTGSGSVRGILLGNSSNTATNNVTNNVIYQLNNPASTVSGTTTATIRGIDLNGTITVNLLHNTVFLNANYTGTSTGHFQTACLYMGSSGSTVLTMQNNIFVNKSATTPTGADTRAVAFYKTTTTIGTQITAATNNNLLFAGTPSTKNLLYIGGSATAIAQNLQQYQSTTTVGINNGGGNRELNSVSVDVPFNSTSEPFDLTINTTVASPVDQGGVATSLTTDHVGATRSASTPDIGAYEFTGTALDVVAPSIIYTPAPTLSYGTGNVSILGVQISDRTGVSTTSAPRIHYRKGTTSAFVSTAGTLASGNANNGSWNFTIDYSLISGGVTNNDVIQYYIIAQDDATTPNVRSNPWLGLVATGVSNITTDPTTPNQFQVVPGTTWTGAISSDWGTAGNWSDGIPTSTSDVLISAYAGSAPVVGTGVVAQASTITVSNPTASLTVNGSGALNIAVRITNSGTINVNGGTVSITGASNDGLQNSSASSVINITDGTVNVGPQDNTLNNRNFTNTAGTLNVSGGTLNVSGVFNISGGTFTQSGGNINVDGNGSTSATAALVSFGTATYNLSGGTFTIIDPNATSGVNSFTYTGSNRANATGTHTFRFGDGASTQAGVADHGFRISNGSSRFGFRNLTINGTNSGTNRFVRVISSSVTVLGTLNVTANSEIRIETFSYHVAGNIVNNGTIISDGTLGDGLKLGDFSTGSLEPATVAQTVSGTGIIKNALTGTNLPNTTFLTINNTSAGGVTFTDNFATFSASEQVIITNGTVGFTSFQPIKGITIANGTVNTNTLLLKGTIDNSSIPVVLSSANSIINTTDLTLDNQNGGSSSGLGRLNVTGVVTTTNGFFSSVSPGQVVLRSTANGTARVTDATSSRLNGTVIVERFIPQLTPADTRRKYRLFASPVSSQTISAGLQQSIHITGLAGTCSTTPDATTGLDISTTGARSMFDYDHARGAGARWGAGIANTLTTNITAGKGFRVLVRGSRSRGCSLLDGTPTIQDAVTLTTAGVLAHGDRSVTLAGEGFTLLGNPYASPIDWNNSAWATLRSSNGISNTYVTYHPENAAGVYTTYDGANLVNGQTLTNGNIIASGQAFFVQKTTASDATIANFFQEGFKSSTAQAGAFRTNSAGQVSSVRIGLKAADSSHLDEAIIAFATSSAITRNFDGNFDSELFTEAATHIATIKGSTKTAIQRRPNTFTSDTVALHLQSNSTANFKLVFSDFNDVTQEIWLRDKYTNTLQDVKQNATYAFNTTNDPASIGSSRFEVIFRNASTLPVTFSGINAKNKGANAVAVNWVVAGEQNITKYEVERSADGTNFTYRGLVNAAGNTTNAVNYSFEDAPRILGTSFYRVKAYNRSGEFKYSPVVSVKNGAGSISITLFPNPVKNEATVLVENSTEGFNVQVLTLAGKQVLQLPKQVATNNIVRLNTSQLPAGVYILQVTTESGSAITQKLIKE